MPYSSTEGKQFVRDYFAGKKIEHVVDVGPGAGTYRDLLGPVTQALWWTGIEVWAPYITQFQLDQKYDEIIVCDVAWLDWDLLGYPDLVIFGDVIEHMDVDPAVRALYTAVHRSKYVVVSVPIIHYPQGAEMGNPWETHRVHYSQESAVEILFDGLEILAYDIGDVVGTYIIRGDQLA